MVLEAVRLRGITVLNLELGVIKLEEDEILPLWLTPFLGTKFIF